MKLNLILALSIAVFSADASILTYNSLSFAGNPAMRASWLAALSESPDFLIDFNSFTDGQNLHGVALGGGLTVNDTNALGVGAFGGFAVLVECTPTGIGGSNPIGACAVEHDERVYLRLAFAIPVDYVSFYDIDSSGTTGFVDFEDATSVAISLDTTAGTFASAEFFGIVRVNGPRIVGVRMDAMGDGVWGIDNVSFGTGIPEPSTLALFSIGMLLVGVGRSRRQRKLPC